MNKTIPFVIVFAISVLIALPISSYGQDKEEAEQLFKVATEHFAKGEYTQAIDNFDTILEIFPDHSQTLKMKAIAESNLGYHEKSLANFYKVLQKNPNDITALTGLGVGFGNFAEYHEAKNYFDKASELAPDNIVVKNYKEFADKVLAKYPYKPTEKPKPIATLSKQTTMPLWIKSNAEWWADGQITDSDFMSGIEYMIKEKIIVISELPKVSNTSGKTIPDWVKNNARWWSDGTISESEFVNAIKYLVENGMISADSTGNQLTQTELESDLQSFKTYVRKVANAVEDEKRYIEYPNPSGDVIKKFLRDKVKWNLGNQVSSGNEIFPDPIYQKIDGVYVIEYKIFVNEQPLGLPLDHVSTLNDSIGYWQSQEFTASNGEPARVKFTYTNAKYEANVWVTWVVRDLGEGVLGHANFRKGVAEVALGDYGCDGSFQLYDVNTVEKIMRHELGHIIGLGHSSDPTSIMYPSLKAGYAYCLLN